VSAAAFTPGDSVKVFRGAYYSAIRGYAPDAYTGKQGVVLRLAGGYAIVDIGGDEVDFHPDRLKYTEASAPSTVPFPEAPRLCDRTVEAEWEGFSAQLCTLAADHAGPCSAFGVRS